MLVTAQSNTLDAVVEGYRTTLYVNYLGIGGAALVLVDFLQTFPEEVSLMWPAPFGLPKVLFFLLRYSLLAHRVLAGLYGVPTGRSPEECWNGFVRTGVMSCALIAGAEGILFLRAYAFSGKNKKLMAYLIFQCVAIHTGAAVLITKFLHSTKFGPLPIPTVCMPLQADSVLLCGAFTMILGSIVIVMLIMVYIALQEHRGCRSALLMIFYRDGIFYFICLSALALANIIVNLVAPEGGLKLLLVQTEVDAHVILATRMLLHLRGWAAQEEDETLYQSRWETEGTLNGRFARALEQIPTTWDVP